MKKLLLLLLFPLSLFGQAVSTRNFDTNYFQIQTNVSPYDITINTNAGSAASSWVTNLSGGPQVWTNAGNGYVQLVGFSGVDGVSPISVVRIDATNGVEIYTPNTGGADSAPAIGLIQSDISLGTRLTIMSDWYAYQRGVGDLVSVFQMNLDGAGYGKTVGIDPANDDFLPFSFLFSTTYSNSVISTDGLFAIQNSHTNKWAVKGNGDLYWGADATVGYRPPSTNALPGQVLASLGNTPQTLYWTNLSSGGGSFVDLWTNDTVAGAYGSLRALRPVDQTRTVAVNVTSTNNQAFTSTLTDTNPAHTYTLAGYFEDKSTNSGSILYYQDGNHGLIGESDANNGAIRAGEGVGVFGVGDSHFYDQFGVAGLSSAQFNNQTNYGVAGSATSNTKTGTKRIGIYAETVTTAPASTANPLPAASAVFAGDSRDTSDTLLRLSTNNGGATVFSVNATGDPVIPGGDGQGKVLMDSDGAGTARWSTTTLTNIVASISATNRGIGPGTLNQIAMFGPTTTNVTNSVMYQVGSSTIQMTNGIATDASVTTRFDLVGRYTDSTHFDELSQFWSVGQGDYEFGTDKGSAGSARQLTFIVGGTRYWDISTAGHLLPITSGTTDIGAGSDGIRNLWVTGGRVLFDNTGVAGIGQIGYAGSPGSAINFQGQRIGFVDAFNAVDVVRIETGSVTPPSKTIVDIGACIIGAGSATGSRNSWFGQDPFNTGNRWVFGTNNTTQAQPAANQIMGSAASGNHSWGGDVQVIGGLSTGSGTNGSVILGTAEGGSAITTQNTPKIRTYIAPEPVPLTESTATLICTVSNITAAHFATVMVVASTFASDGTDHQSVGESFIVSCVNKGGTLTATVSASSPMSTTTSAGTLTTAYTAVANANGFDLKNNAVSSLVQTKLNTRWRIESIDSDTTPFIFDSAGKHF